MKKQVITLLTLVLLLAQSLPSQITSKSDGEWSSPSTWSGDKVPSPNDKVVIYHHIHHHTGITVGSNGSLLVEKGGHLSMDGKFWNYGGITNLDSIDFDGYEGPGTLINTGYLESAGWFTIRPHGNFYQSGHLQIEGRFVHEGYMEITGTIYATELEHWGESVSPPGKSGRIDLCGDGKHYPNAIVTGNVYLCVHCGGIYLRHAGAIRDFNLDCGAFPVVLEDFQTVVQGPGEVMLTWRTASETNSREFVVERATVKPSETCAVGKCSSTIEFSPIAKIPAAGNSNAPRSYQYVDRTVPTGMNYYRLRMVDADGSSTLSWIEEVLMVEGKSVLQVFPNPTNEVLHIRITENLAGEAEVAMYSIDGREIWKRTITVSEGVAAMDVQVCEFAAGTYLVVYKQGAQKQTKKVIFIK